MVKYFKPHTNCLLLMQLATYVHAKPWKWKKYIFKISFGSFTQHIMCETMSKWGTSASQSFLLKKCPNKSHVSSRVSQEK